MLLPVPESADWQRLPPPRCLIGEKVRDDRRCWADGEPEPESGLRKDVATDGEMEAGVGMGRVEADPAGLEVEANPAKPTDENPDDPLCREKQIDSLKTCRDSHTVPIRMKSFVQEGGVIQSCCRAK